MIPLKNIHRAICFYYDVDINYPFVENRKTKPIYLRQLFHYLSMQLNEHYLSYQDIGEYLPYRIFSRATVMNSCKQFQNRIDSYKNIKNDIEDIKKLLKNG